MGVTININENGYVTYTIQADNVIWTVDEEGRILDESFTDKELARERSLI